MTATAKTSATISIMSAILGFAITFGSTVWFVAQKDATYETKLEFIERNLETLDSRLDTSEAFRATLMTDLAEIKTDLLWIRRALEQND
jgi:septal ring factor EnvC (AmiA/AmiB activator)